MRRKTRQIKVGNLIIGGNAPVSIQGMAKVSTLDLKSLLKEVKSMIKEGAEIVRVAIKEEREVNSIKILKDRFKVPFVADIHYSVSLAILSIKNGFDKIRINPGNINKGGLKEIIKVAKDFNIPVRIGVNSGSIEIKNSLVESMVNFTESTVKFFQDNDFHSIIISAKTPFVESTIEVYRRISEIFDYPLHLGITEAGRGYLALSKSILGIGILLKEGIGDTIRVSLSTSAKEEIKVAKSILQALNLRIFEPEIISCPTCGRIKVNLNKVLKEVEKEVKKLAEKNSLVKNLKIAVMGCSVNGPGEAKQADIGIAGGKKKFVLFKKGSIIGTYKEEKIVKVLIEEVKNMVL